jgi:hypothetical protein
MPSEMHSLMDSHGVSAPFLKIKLLFCAVVLCNVALVVVATTAAAAAVAQ